MNTAVKQYTKELYKQFNYLATWLPGTPLNLGDIGVLNKNEFVAISNLKELGIAFEVEEDTTKSDLKYLSNQAVSITTKLAGTAPVLNSVLSEADAGFSVEFSRENAVLFKANGTLSPRIKNQIKLGEEIIERFKKGEWDKNWVVITELIKADSSTIIISSSSNGKIELRAKANISAGNLDIANASLNLEPKFEKDLETNIICGDKLTPLFKASKVKNRWFSDPVFRTRKITPINFLTPKSAIESPESIYFDEAEFQYED